MTTSFTSMRQIKRQMNLLKARRVIAGIVVLASFVLTISSAIRYSWEEVETGSHLNAWSIPMVLGGIVIGTAIVAFWKTEVALDRLRQEGDTSPH